MISSRGAGAGDDTGSMVMAMLIIAVGVAMSVLLGAVVVNHIGATRVSSARIHALHAAQAGLDSATAQIRAADDGRGNGVRTSLPCGPLSGTVGGGGASRYQVVVFYVRTDPQAQMNRDPGWFAANDIDCTPGYGPLALPAYAVLFSTGTGPTSSRVLRGAYRFRTTNQNIAGGRIHIFQTSGSTNSLCMDTGTTTDPAPGTNVQMLACDSSRPEQVFAYTADSTLMLVQSVTAARPWGMCLDAGDAANDGALVRFEPCQSPVPAHQKWVYNGRAQFEGVKDNDKTTGLVFQMTSADAVGSFVELTKSPIWDGSYNNVNSFSPEASVGPGDAGPRHKHLINFKQFGRCLDLLGGNHTLTRMVAWSCKRSWNQAFTTPPVTTGTSTAVAGKITIEAPANEPSPKGTYCLKSPRTTATGVYVSMVACTGAEVSADFQWRVYGSTGNYATSYRILDVDGNCLQPSDLTETPTDREDNGGSQISRIVLRPCDDSTLQKWNANPDVLEGIPLKYLGER